MAKRRLHKKLAHVILRRDHLILPRDIAPHSLSEHGIWKCFHLRANRAELWRVLKRFNLPAQSARQRDVVAVHSRDPLTARVRERKGEGAGDANATCREGYNASVT